MNKCRRTGKNFYSNLEDAEWALESCTSRKGKGSPRQESRVYRCPRCKGFHLTSKAKREEEECETPCG